MLQSYLYDELARVGTEECKQSILRKLSGLKLVWTGPKAALIELMYGLQTAGVFNESKADIRQIAAVFESVFNIELGDYYRTYQAIRIRKKNRTSFIDALKDSLVQRMDDTDERAYLNSR
jgi:predicted nucleic-acid-binding protein